MRRGELAALALFTWLSGCRSTPITTPPPPPPGQLTPRSDQVLAYRLPDDLTGRVSTSLDVLSARTEPCGWVDRPRPAVSGDADGDGYPDDLDDCPDVAPTRPTHVNNVMRLGCQPHPVTMEGRFWRIPELEFERGATRLTDAHRADLRGGLVGFLRHRPFPGIRKFHLNTFDQPLEPDRQRLGRARLGAARAWLLDAGVPAAQIALEPGLPLSAHPTQGGQIRVDQDGYAEPPRTAADRARWFTRSGYHAPPRSSWLQIPPGLPRCQATAPAGGLTPVALEAQPVLRPAVAPVREPPPEIEQAPWGMQLQEPGLDWPATEHTLERGVWLSNPGPRTAPPGRLVTTGPGPGRLVATGTEVTLPPLARGDSVLVSLRPAPGQARREEHRTLTPVALLESNPGDEFVSFEGHVTLRTRWTLPAPRPDGATWFEHPRRRGYRLQQAPPGSVLLEHAVLVPLDGRGTSLEVLEVGRQRWLEFIPDLTPTTLARLEPLAPFLGEVFARLVREREALASLLRALDEHRPRAEMRALFDAQQELRWEVDRGREGMPALHPAEPPWESPATGSPWPRQTDVQLVPLEPFRWSKPVAARSPG